MSMWHHFTEAADYLASLDEQLVPKAHQLSKLIEKWPKFYIPEAGDLSRGRSFDEMRSVMRLPYPGIVTLREQALVGADFRLKVLTMFWEWGEVTVEGAELFADKHCLGTPSWGAFSMAYSAGRGWTPIPPAMFVIFGNGSGFGVQIQDTAGVRACLSDDFSIDDMFGECSQEPYALLETCMLLNCNNVEAVAVPAPKFVNKKRISKGKRPLYEYHVLKVDGEVWDSPSATTRDGSGVRSHFRRGHFRRLDEARMTWVRATMVKGSVPGFVDKDYDIKPRALT